MEGAPTFAARLGGWWARLLPGQRAHGVSSPPAELVARVVEQVVDGTDPRIRAVSGYARKLHPAVERTLAHFGACSAWLPAPIEVSARRWAVDPLLRTLFASVADMQQIFSCSRGLRAFFRDHPQSTEVFAGLAVTRGEHTALGMALIDDQVQHDVVQTTVTFADYRVFGACGSEQELRQRTEQRGLNFLIGEVLEQIAERKAREHGLGEERVLRLKLRALEQKRPAVESAFDPGGTLEAAISRLQKQLAERQHASAGGPAGFATLDDYLTQIREVLGNPERYVCPRTVQLRVNRMNIKVESPAEPADEITLSEVTIGRRPPRVVVLTRYPRAELLPEHDLLDEACRLLGMPPPA